MARLAPGRRRKPLREKSVQRRCAADKRNPRHPEYLVWSLLFIPFNRDVFLLAGQRIASKPVYDN